MASIVRYEPFSLIDRWTRPSADRFFERFDRMVQEALSGPSGVSDTANPGMAANLYETSEGYWVELPLPGVKSEALELSVQQNLLTIKAERRGATPENAQTLWQGFGPGRLHQTLTLPGEVDAERVEARLEDGVLRLHLPKAEHLRPRQIKVQAGGDVKTIEAKSVEPNAGNAQ